MTANHHGHDSVHRDAVRLEKILDSSHKGSEEDMQRVQAELHAEYKKLGAKGYARLINELSNLDKKGTGLDIKKLDQSGSFVLGWDIYD